MYLVELSITSAINMKLVYPFSRRPFPGGVHSAVLEKEGMQKTTRLICHFFSEDCLRARGAYS